MHQPGAELGAAVRKLMRDGIIDDAVRRRFVRIGTATTRETLAYRLREIITLLRREAIPLDYALLAAQLYQAQTSDGMRQVRQRWGRSFHAHRAQIPGDIPADDSPTDDSPADTDKDAS
jgi:CRISPR system Cascade subunit CasB